MEYKKYKLGDICKIFGRIGFRGYTTEDLVSSPSNGAISLSPSNIVDGVMDLSKCTYISWEKYEESPEIKVAPNDIVIVKTGNSYGRTAIIRNVEHPMTLNPQFVVLKDIQINPVYLAYFLKTDEFQKQIYGIVGGSAIPTLSQEDLANLIVRVPNENTQNTIADILDSLDGKIEINKRINDNLEAMAKQLYDYWFVQFDFPNEEGKPYKSSGGAMVWNEKLKREIPSCFEVVNMGNLCDFRNGINYSKDESGNDYQIVNVRNISSSRILLDGEDFDVITVPTSKAENYVLKPDDIIIARSGCPGSTRLLLSPANTLFCGFIICCSPNDSSMRNYLVYCLKQLEGTNATTSGGSILQNVSQDTLKGLHVIVPQKQIIDKFNKTIELIFARMLNCLKECKALTKQRDELLPLLMNGQATINYHLSTSTCISFDISVLFLNFTNGNSLYETISLDYQCFALPLHSKENTHGTIQEDKRHIQQRQRQGD